MGKPTQTIQSTRKYHSRNWKKLLLIYFIIALTIYGIVYSVFLSKKSSAPSNSSKEQYLQLACERTGGRWLTKYQECEIQSSVEGLNAITCKSLGGKFDECASPCRHNPDSDICMSSCDMVCKFN